MGAGASASDGAPLQKDLFKSFFNSLTENEMNKNSYFSDMMDELREFFLQMFGIEIYHKQKINDKIFPIFEELLGILDLAYLKNENFLNFKHDNIAWKDNKISLLRQFIVLVMAKAIDYTVSWTNYHKQLIENLVSNNLINKTMFFSTNYDVLIENALLKFYPKLTLDYCVDFYNYNMNNDWKKPTKKSIKVFKLHGSLNWLYGQTCNIIKLSIYEKGVINIIDKISEASCPRCIRTLMSPIIIPPTYFKNFSNIFLNCVWNNAEYFLREVNHIIFCGYSFPDADIHIKYLLKRVETNRNYDKKDLKR